MVVLVSLTLVASKTKESDSDALNRFKADQAIAPVIKYPVTDLRGRHIPRFDYLLVFPQCESCSDFRKKAKKFMESKPEYTFLILTPDMKESKDLLTHNRYFVFQFDSKSEYAKIPAGRYVR